MGVWIAVAYVISVIVFIPPLVVIGIKILGRFYSQYIDWLDERLGL